MRRGQNKTKSVFLLTVFAALAGIVLLSSADATGERDIWTLYVKKDTWQQTMLASRRVLKKAETSQKELWKRIEKDFPIQCDWVYQDYGMDFHRWFGNDASTDIERKIIGKVLAELGSEGRKLAVDFERLCRSNVSPNDKQWLNLYVEACEKRRRIRLQPLLSKCKKIVFTKHFNMGGSHYAYTEAQSDAQHERNFIPGSALCLLEMEGYYSKVRTLINEPDGVIRDPDVSYDGRRILFAWKKSDRGDDYHLYEMEVETGKVRQLTFGLGVDGGQQSLYM
jgi:hypothetical protein